MSVRFELSIKIMDGLQVKSGWGSVGKDMKNEKIGGKVYEQLGFRRAGKKNG